jgi:hypothetical protein
LQHNFIRNQNINLNYMVTGLFSNGGFLGFHTMSNIFFVFGLIEISASYYISYKK